MKHTPLATQLESLLSGLDNAHARFSATKYVKKRDSALSRLTSKTGVSNEDRAAFIILLNAVIIGTATIAVKLPVNINLAIVLPLSVAAAVGLALTIWRLAARQRSRKPERLEAVAHLRNQSLITPTEAEDLKSRIEAGCR